MKHLGRITIESHMGLRDMARTEPGYADAKTDFLNAIWRAWSDFVFQKKNETQL